MNYTIFAIRYTRAHPDMNEETLARAIDIAWQRYNNARCSDVYVFWMQDIMLLLGVRRALAKFGVDYQVNIEKIGTNPFFSK